MSSTIDIYCDLDGVLVAFEQAAFRLWGVPFINGLVEYPLGYGWDIVGALNHLREGEGLEPVSGNRFWNGFDYDFWRNLPMYPGAALFFNELKKLGSVKFATSPTLSSECVAGKYDWVANNIPEMERRLYIGADKTAFARPGAILIDDRDKNVYNFLAAGGQAVLVPRPWNCVWEPGGWRHTHGRLYKDVLACVKEIINANG